MYKNAVPSNSLRSMKRSKSVGIMATFSLVAIAIFPAAPSAATAVESTEFSDEQIVQGLVFGEGSFAEMLDLSAPLPDGISEQERLEYQNIVQVISADLMANEDQLTEIMGDIRSQNPYRVLAGMDALGKSFGASLEQNFPQEITPGSQPDLLVCGPTVCAAAVVAAVAAVTAIAAANFNVAANINVIYNQNGLWTVNGRWVDSRDGVAEVNVGNLPSVDPTQTVQHYPSLVRAEVASRVASAL